MIKNQQHIKPDFSITIQEKHARTELTFNHIIRDKNASTTMTTQPRHQGIQPNNLPVSLRRIIRLRTVARN